VSALDKFGLGTAPLGNLFSAVSDAEAEATVQAAWSRGVRYFDTAPQYGHGLAEIRLGRALAAYPRDEYRLVSKVGRVLDAPLAGAQRPASSFVDLPALDPVFDYSRDGVLRSFEDSLRRLGVDRLDVVHVHDPDAHEAEALATAFDTLIELRDQGVIGAVGSGMNQVAMLARFVEQVDLDCILLAGRYTLLDRTGERLLERCIERSVEVIAGGVFNSGVLANPAVGATFDYAAAAPELVERAQRMQTVCERFATPLPAAAIQFVGRHPAITMTLVGARSVAEIEADISYAELTIDPALWEALEAV
jgi:D-threo-aldose 1-dehydrogenase